MKKAYEHRGHTYFIVVYPNVSTSSKSVYNAVLHDEVDRQIKVHRVNGMLNEVCVTWQVADDSNIVDKIQLVRDVVEAHINEKFPVESKIVTQLKQLGFE